MKTFSNLQCEEHSADCPAPSQPVHYGHSITYIALHRGSRAQGQPWPDVSQGPTSGLPSSSALWSQTKRFVPLELQSGINQRNAAEKAATSSGCTNQGGAIRGGKKKVAGDVLILLNDGKEHQSAQNIFLPNFCHDGLGYVFSSGSGMQVRLSSHVWFWGQFCSESVLATMTNQHAKILPCLWDSLKY